MRHVAFFDKSTGILHQKSVLVSEDSAIALNTPEGHQAIDHPAGKMLDHRTQRIDVTTGSVVDHQPAAPSEDERRVATRLAASRRIAQLEASQPRALREYALGDDGSKVRLKAIDDEIAALRASL